MGGNFLGGAVALLYFLMFQLCGVTLAACFLNKERRYTQRIFGSAAGSVLLMWLPSLWAFLFSFSITAHVLALISLLLLTVGAVFLKFAFSMLIPAPAVLTFMSTAEKKE